MASGSSWTWDNASTWEPVTRAPLLVCAHANSAVTTKSGVVMVAGRFPGLSLMVSWDDAMSWEFYLIDTSGFAARLSSWSRMVSQAQQLPLPSAEA